MPIKRKGREINHINGHKISAIKASGQQMINSNNQQINVSMWDPVLKNTATSWLDTVNTPLDSHAFAIYLQALIYTPLFKGITVVDFPALEAAGKPFGALFRGAVCKFLRTNCAGGLFLQMIITNGCCCS